MEPPLPPLHPRVPELLEHLGLVAVDAIKWNVLACVEKGNTSLAPTIVLKFGSDRRKQESIVYEIRVMREVLPSVDHALFERLVLPEFVAEGTFEDVRWMTMRYIPGKQLVHDWSEVTMKSEVLGGRGIDADIARSAVDVLRDLRLVDISGLPKFIRRFDFAKWLEDYHAKSAAMVQKGIMEQETVDSASRLFMSKQVKRYEGSMFTNGDFYPRNFVFTQDGKIALVDWVGGVDPWEFVAMYAWLMMWGNAQWQAEYVREIKQHFPVDVAEMQVGLLVRSFDMIYRWHEEPEEQIGFARTQMLAYFRQCLDINYVKELFG